MGDRLRAGKSPRFVTCSHTSKLSLLPSAGRKMSTGQSMVMLYGCGVRKVWFIPFVDKRVGGK